MTSIDELKNKVPLVKAWIIDLLNKNQGKGQFVAQYNFPNLKFFFDQRILNSAKVIVIDKVPQVPLASLGLPQFSGFENGNYAGVTYLNTYFVATGYIQQESLHFHELIHVVQWERLGIDKFILLYGLFLLQHGYRDSPLEDMAFKYQNLFEQKKCPTDLISRICNEVDHLYISLSKQFSI